MARVVHFEIYTDDPQAVAPFYEKVFGWEIKKWDGPQEYWVATTGTGSEVGINGGLLRPRFGQSSGTLNTIAVDSIDETLAQIERIGGKVCVPKMEIPNVGQLAYAQDPAGNTFGVLQPDPSMARNS